MSKIFAGMMVGVIVGIVVMCLCVVGDDCYYDPDGQE
jgi:hypothetical protein